MHSGQRCLPVGLSTMMSTSLRERPAEHSGTSTHEGGAGQGEETPGALDLKAALLDTWNRWQRGCVGRQEQCSKHGSSSGSANLEPCLVCLWGVSSSSNLHRAPGGCHPARVGREGKDVAAVAVDGQAEARRLMTGVCGVRFDVEGDESYHSLAK